MKKIKVLKLFMMLKKFNYDVMCLFIVGNDYICESFKK